MSDYKYESCLMSDYKLVVMEILIIKGCCNE